jgi:hypothetical protein
MLIDGLASERDEIVREELAALRALFDADQRLARGICVLDVFERLDGRGTVRDLLDRPSEELCRAAAELLEFLPPDEDARV